MCVFIENHPVKVHVHLFMCSKKKIGLLPVLDEFFELILIGKYCIMSLDGDKYYRYVLLKGI